MQLIQMVNNFHPRHQLWTQIRYQKTNPQMSNQFSWGKAALKPKLQ
jgi:hypothetical protein